jgi:hypothetical protein
MPAWVNIVLPIATLVLGSLLTMAGQALRDRRMDERDKRARYEGFLAGNFEMHRSAMLEMQEQVKNFFDTFWTEKQRRTNEGFYQYFKDWPLGELIKKEARTVVSVEEMTDAIIGTTPISVKEISDAIINASSDTERCELENALTNVLKAATKEVGEKTERRLEEAKRMLEEAEMVREETENLSTVLASLYPFWNEYAQFAGKLQVNMYRSGSNSVVKSGEAFIDAIHKWNEYYRADGSQSGFTEQVQTARHELNRALANALKFGPYYK